MTGDGEPSARGPRSLSAPDAALETIREHVEGLYPEEACGGLLGRAADDGAAEIVEIVPATNVRRDERARRYLIGPDEVLEIERRAQAAGLDVIGYYHSHPDHPPVPSEFDREHAWPWYIYVIASVENGRTARIGAWRLADDRGAFLRVPFRLERSPGDAADRGAGGPAD